MKNWSSLRVVVVAGVPFAFLRPFPCPCPFPWADELTHSGWSGKAPGRSWGPCTRLLCTPASFWGSGVSRTQSLLGRRLRCHERREHCEFLGVLDLGVHGHPAAGQDGASELD